MKKIASVFSILVLCFCLAACGSKTEENNNDNSNVNNNNQSNQSINSLTDFIAEVKKIVSNTKETVMMASFVGAEEGYKLTAENEARLEIYLFSKNSDVYKEAEKNQKITMEGIGSYDATVKNGYALQVDKEFPEYNKILNLFEKMK